MAEPDCCQRVHRWRFDVSQAAEAGMGRDGIALPCPALPMPAGNLLGKNRRVQDKFKLVVPNWGMSVLEKSEVKY